MKLNSKSYPLNPKIIFMGTPTFGAIILEKLAQSEHKPVLVITAPDKPVGRKQIITHPPVKVIAQKYKITVEQPEKIQNTRYKIQNTKPDLVVVAAYGQILPKEILEIPKFGCLNVHPSLLPRWRGASPIQYTILNGDKETGVTIIKVTEKVDEGPIIANCKLKIENLRITFEELHNKLAEKGANLLLETIPKLIKGEIKPQQQDETKATYSKIIKKGDGRIDWKKPAEYIEGQVRAFNPWPGTYTLYKEKRLKILKAEVLKNQLIIKKVQLEGKKPMSFEEFLRGHQDFIGTILK